MKFTPVISSVVNRRLIRQGPSVQAIFQISVECSKLNEASQEEKRGQTQQLTLCQFYVNYKRKNCILSEL